MKTTQFVFLRGFSYSFNCYQAQLDVEAGMKADGRGEEAELLGGGADQT